MMEIVKSGLSYALIAAEKNTVETEQLQIAICFYTSAISLIFFKPNLNAKNKIII